jgi:hypothetical protein
MMSLAQNRLTCRMKTEKKSEEKNLSALSSVRAQASMIGKTVSAVRKACLSSDRPDDARISSAALATVSTWRDRFKAASDGQQLSARVGLSAAAAAAENERTAARSPDACAAPETSLSMAVRASGTAAGAGRSPSGQRLGSLYGNRPRGRPVAAGAWGTPGPGGAGEFVSMCGFTVA